MLWTAVSEECCVLLYRVLILEQESPLPYLWVTRTESYIVKDEGEMK